MCDPEGAGEVSEVGAAAHADVLAVIDDLPGGLVDKRRRPAAEPIAHSMSVTAIPPRQAAGCRQPGQSRAENDNRIGHANGALYCTANGLLSQQKGLPGTAPMA